MYFNIEIIANNLSNFHDSVKNIKIQTIEFGEMVILSNYTDSIFTIQKNSDIEILNKNNQKQIIKTNSIIDNIAMIFNNKLSIYLDSFSLN